MTRFSMIQLMAISLCIAKPAFADGGAVPVGLAKVDITPDYPIRLSGYGGRTEESAGVEQRIWAKAMAIGADDDGPVVLITVENCGVPGAMTDEVADRLQQKKGITRRQVAICSSHSHTAPMLTGVLPLLFGAPIPEEHKQRIDRYTRELTDHLERISLIALADRRPCRLEWTVGKAAFAKNRRRQPGPADHSLPLLRVVDAAGRLRAVFVRYACHCTCMTGEHNRICGDWAGYAQEDIERDHRGALALVAIGCGGDANPNPRGELQHAKQNGAEIAREVNRLLERQMTPVTGAVTARLETIDLPFDKLPTKDEWEEKTRSTLQAAVYHAKVNLQRLEEGQSPPTSLAYTIQTWTFGDDLAMVFLPGEVVQDYEVRLDREFDAARLWINAYANDVPCYIPSRRILREGGYEAETSMIYYDRPARLAPAVEDMIVDTVRKLLPPEFRSSEK